jgi:hypothetical protein
MNTKVPYKVSEIDVNNICYTDIKNNSKKTIIYIKYMDNNKLKNLVFQTPTLISNNMIQCKNNIFELDIPLIGKDQTKTTEFIEFLNKIDKKIIKDAKINNKWFERFTNIKTMKYQKLIRTTEDNSGAIRLKLLRTDDFETIVQQNTKRINIEEIGRECWLKSILEIYAIWINENGFGLFIRPILINVKPCMKLLYDYKFADESDGEGEEDDIEVDTMADNSIFIRSESEITSSVLEMPSEHYMNKKSEDESKEEYNKDTETDTDTEIQEAIHNSSDELVEKNEDELNSTTSED